MIMIGPRTSSSLRARQDPWHTELVPVAVTTMSEGAMSSAQTISAARAWRPKAVTMPTIRNMMTTARLRAAIRAFSLRWNNFIMSFTFSTRFAFDNSVIDILNTDARSIVKGDSKVGDSDD